MSLWSLIRVFVLASSTNLSISIISRVSSGLVRARSLMASNSEMILPNTKNTTAFIFQHKCFSKWEFVQIFNFSAFNWHHLLKSLVQERLTLDSNLALKYKNHCDHQPSNLFIERLTLHHPLVSIQTEYHNKILPVILPFTSKFKFKELRSCQFFPTSWQSEATQAKNEYLKLLFPVANKQNNIFSHIFPSLLFESLKSNQIKCSK